MAISLEDILTSLLPQILPSDPQKRQSGPQLKEALLKRFPQELHGYAPLSIQQTISNLARRPNSILAKLDGKQGYFLKAAIPSESSEHSPSPDAAQIANISSPASETSPAITSTDDVPGARDAQDEEKFRSIFTRYAETENRYCMVVDHTRARKRDAGLDKWKYPDLVEVAWDAGDLTEDGYRLDPALLDVKRSLGEQPFTLASVELKSRLSTSGFREAFFQCVSNSKWAHRAILAVAEPVSEEKLADELRRLGTSYDVTVLSYSLKPGRLAELPDASAILKMCEADFDMIAQEIDVRTVVTGQPRDLLDWSYVSDMRERSDEFRDLFLWISKCLELKKILTFAAYAKLSEHLRQAQAIAQQ